VTTNELDLPGIISAAGAGPLAFFALGIILLGYLATRWFGAAGLSTRMGVFLLLAAIICSAPFAVRLASIADSGRVSADQGSGNVANPGDEIPTVDAANVAFDKTKNDVREVSKAGPCPAAHLVGASTPDGSEPWTVDIDLGASKVGNWTKRDGSHATRLVVVSDCDQDDISVRLIPQDPPEIPSLVCLGTRNNNSVEMTCHPDKGPKEEFVGILKG